MNYRIGSDYRYGGSKKRFKLVKVSGCIFRFACGHWCTDNVFIGLIDCSTGIMNCDNNQLELPLYSI